MDFVNGSKGSSRGASTYSQDLFSYKSILLLGSAPIPGNSSLIEHLLNFLSELCLHGQSIDSRGKLPCTSILICHLSLLSADFTAPQQHVKSILQASIWRRECSGSFCLQGSILIHCRNFKIYCRAFVANSNLMIQSSSLSQTLMAPKFPLMVDHSSWLW